MDKLCIEIFGDKKGCLSERVVEEENGIQLVWFSLDWPKLRAALKSAKLDSKPRAPSKLLGVLARQQKDVPVRLMPEFLSHKPFSTIVQPVLVDIPESENKDDLIKRVFKLMK